MSSTAFSDIRRALEKRLSSGTYTSINNTLDIAYENVSFIPDGKDAWLEVRFSVEDIRPSFVGSGTRERYDGMFRIICYVKRANNGAYPLDNLANEVKNRYYSGLELVENSERVIIKNAVSSRSLYDSSWRYLTIDVFWYVYID